MRLIPLIALLVACTGEGPDDSDDHDCTPGSSPLSGLIAGEAWTLAVGDTDAFLSEPDELWATLYGEATEICGFGPTGPKLLVRVPTTPGDYDFGFSFNATFAYQDGDVSENLATFDGFMRVDEVTETTASGAVCAWYDDDNDVSGTFTVDICE